ncbi:unnamed protein product, partial [Amoebophrya sp. A120]
GIRLGLDKVEPGTHAKSHETQIQEAADRALGTPSFNYSAKALTSRARCDVMSLRPVRHLEDPDTTSRIKKNQDVIKGNFGFTRMTNPPPPWTKAARYEDMGCETLSSFPVIFVADAAGVQKLKVRGNLKSLTNLTLP